MTIKILPARLANQIAAGEVVERPASVVKELIENSLDSGATRIDIDIEKGGSKLIRVRDNGKGIVKDELGLALSRHATSKIHTLDDLEAIMSLGFRGEALASISSVSRLTLTSRTATQDQAWSAYSEGRDMAVKLQPAAHPVGTTVEVLDLFFNTPARRKFLRTDKTEFTHIDELLKRIALSRFDVTINLKHNGKMVRQYRGAKSSLQAEKRIAAVCGSGFVKHMLNIELEHNGLKLHGWITAPEGARQQSDLQYCYVNGRMMRDKLINHAIRQSYETSLRPDQFASYILFIELDPHQVDVNVHPAKHEVRFHQSRLVHDFIYQALADALAQSNYIDAPVQTESAYHIEQRKSAEVQISEAVERVPAYPGRADYDAALSSKPKRQSDWVDSSKPEAINRRDSGSAAPQSLKKPISGNPTQSELKVYQQLLTVPEANQSEVAVVPTKQLEGHTVTSIGKAYSIVHGHYLVAQSDAGDILLSIQRAEWYRILGQLQVSGQSLTVQPLLVPLSLKVSADDLAIANQCRELLTQFAIQLKEKNSGTILVMGVPQPLRQQNLQQLIPDLLSYLSSQDGRPNVEEVSVWLASRITQVKKDYTLSEAINLLSELEQLWEGQFPLHDTSLVQVVDYSATITKFNENLVKK